MHRGLGFRLESMIGYQKPDDYFLVEYRKLIGLIKEKMNQGYYDFEVSRDDTAKKIQELINKRFNMNVHLVTDQHTAAIFPFFANDANVFMDELWKKEGGLASTNAFLKLKTSTRGFVDLENAKLGGDFSKGQSTLYINYNTLLGNNYQGGHMFSYNQIMAVTLHEIGHTFYPLAFATHIDKSNIIFEQATRDLTDNNADRREVVHRALTKDDKDASPTLANDICSENPIAVTKALIKLLGEKTLSHQVNAKYSNTNFEMMADNFATRFGLGKELVEALEKLTLGGVRYGDLIRSIFETIKVIQHLLTLLTFWKAASKLSNTAAKVIYFLLITFVFGLGSVIFFYILVRMSGESSRNYTYDDLVVRYNRIRLQMINDIKSNKFRKNEAKKIIASVDFIGNLIKEGANWRTPLDHLFNALNPDDRRAKDSIGRQQMLENLINNDLFLASLKLQQLV